MNAMMPHNELAGLILPLHTIDLTQYGSRDLVQVFGAAQYASGDRIIFIDAPWVVKRPNGGYPSDYKHIVMCFREVGAVGDWRVVWGNPDKVFSWVKTANVGDTAKVSNRRFTKLDPFTLPSSIVIADDASKTRF